MTRYHSKYFQKQRPPTKELKVSIILTLFEIWQTFKYQVFVFQGLQYYEQDEIGLYYNPFNLSYG